jgi:hypothetical protein
LVDGAAGARSNAAAAVDELAATIVDHAAFGAHLLTQARGTSALSDNTTAAARRRFRAGAAVERVLAAVGNLPALCLEVGAGVRVARHGAAAVRTRATAEVTRAALAAFEYPTTTVRNTPALSLQHLAGPGGAGLIAVAGIRHELVIAKVVITKDQTAVRESRRGDRRNHCPKRFR